MVTTRKQSGARREEGRGTEERMESEHGHEEIDAMEL